MLLLRLARKTLRSLLKRMRRLGEVAVIGGLLRTQVKTMMALRVRVASKKGTNMPLQITSLEMLTMLSLPGSQD